MAPAIVFILAFFIRAYNLLLFPLNHDEATWTLGSLENFNKFMGIPVSCFRGYIQPFFSYLVFLSKGIFSLPEYIVRVPAALVGTATVILIYHLAKEMYGRKTGLISAVLLCFLPWHAIQSRTGVSLILTPFFGCLIFLALFKALQKQSNLWFMLAWGLLGIGSFYTYQASLLFIPIFLVTLLYLRKGVNWLKMKTALISLVLFLLILSPLIYLHSTGQLSQYSGKVYRLYYQDEPFRGTWDMLLSKLIINLKNNGAIASESLFFYSGGRMLYGAALIAPLLIHWGSLFAIIISAAFSLWRRNNSDIILLIWLSLGFLGGIAGVRFFQPRYIIIILVPALIFIAKFIAGIFVYIKGKSQLIRALLVSAGIFILGSLFLIETTQLISYYFNAPLNLEECRRNSYGCKETAKYLANIPQIKHTRLITQSRMEPIYTYLDFFVSGRQEKNANKETKVPDIRETCYYIIWAPESWPQDYWGGEFSGLWKYFKNKYPQIKPEKTIYYPNGMPAIHIFKVINDDFPK